METIDGTIELSIPPDARLLRMVRLVAAGLATTAGFDVDELDDLRIAVDEAVTALLEGGDGDQVPLRFDVSAGQVTMTGTTPASGSDPLDADRIELSSPDPRSGVRRARATGRRRVGPGADLPSRRRALRYRVSNTGSRPDASAPRDREAEMQRFREYKADPTQEERAALVEQFAWVARHCARRFADRGEPFDDLLQVGHARRAEGRSTASTPSTARRS